MLRITYSVRMRKFLKKKEIISSEMNI